MLKEREFLQCNSHSCTSVKIRIIPKDGYYKIYPSQSILVLDLNLVKFQKYGSSIFAKNMNETPIVTYQRQTLNPDEHRTYIDPTKLYALNVYTYSRKRLCYLLIEIKDDRVYIRALPLNHLDCCHSCLEYIIEDKERGVGVALSPYSFYLAKLTEKDRERNFAIRVPSGELKNDKGESVDLLLKIREI